MKATRADAPAFPTLGYMPACPEVTSYGGMTVQQWLNALAAHALIARRAPKAPMDEAALKERAHIIVNSMTTVGARNWGAGSAFPDPHVDGAEGMTVEQWHAGWFMHALIARGDDDDAVGAQAMRLAHTMTAND